VSGCILPGATLGVLGGGQLGRMFAIAARRLGYRVHVLAEGDATPASQIADQTVQADYNDTEAVARFARSVAVVTFEFENVPAQATEVAAQHAPVRPGGHILHTTQNRVREKTFLRAAGIPVTPFVAVHSAAELQAALLDLGTPAILKTEQWGYDGKGQVLVSHVDDPETVWRAFGARAAILERCVEFERELSVVAVRGENGAFAAYGPIENAHRDHILDLSVAPMDIPVEAAARAVDIALTIVEKLELVGVLCVEYFLCTDGELLVNELAPRPHNSGHLTIDAHVCDQFEQQVRAICGLPLGSTRQRTPAAMANLLGQVWEAGEPDWAGCLRLPDVKLHLYGKETARRGRKMGHLTALAPSAADARTRVLAARAALTARP
jgi:5-(carboxyamino)imidazole ribonucleotide synthase